VKEQSSFGLMMDASLLFKVFVIFPNQGTTSSLLESYKGKGSVSVLSCSYEIFKEGHVKFQAERVGNAYMLQNLKVMVGGLQLSSASEAAVEEQSETMMISSSNIQ